MAYVDRYDAAFGVFVSRYMRNVHTNIRGSITEVDYGNATISVQPSAFTQYPSGTIDKFPAIHDIPLQLPSGNGGKARLTMPVKPGDLVGLAFSERNEEDNTDTGTHEMSPGWATTHGLGKAIDPDNVVLENDKSQQVMKPNGDMSFTNPTTTVQYLADGNVKIDNGAGSLSVSPSGEIVASNSQGSMKMDTGGELNVNGAKITKAGRIITAEGIDMDDFYSQFVRHTHGGVDTGNGTTSPPNNIGQ